VREYFRKAAREAAFLLRDIDWRLQPKKVFNISVENSVEKPGRIFVSDSAGDGSTLCTTPGAGTFGVRCAAL
jgi:hypothetical protein